MPSSAIWTHEAENVTPPDLTELASKLPGSWSLESWLRVSSDGTGDGTERHPFGQDALGSLVYVLTRDDSGWLGRMSAQLSVRSRPGLHAPPTSGERVREKSAAFDSYLAYSGRWRLDGTRVIHAVELSLYPAWVGTELVRTVSFVGDRLVLSALPDPDDAHVGSRRVAQHLRWRRNS